MEVVRYVEKKLVNTVFKVEKGYGLAEIGPRITLSDLDLVICLFAG